MFTVWSPSHTISVPPVYADRAIAEHRHIADHEREDVVERGIVAYWRSNLRHDASHTWFVLV
jgi:hypothetical protein